MLLIASREAVQDRDVENLVSLSLPIKVHELLQTLEMMEGRMRRRRKKQRSQPQHRSEEEETLLRRAKAVLMERNGFSEDEAHRYIQKRSMENGTGIVEVAQMILCLLHEG
jgi:response regulator NasT